MIVLRRFAVLAALGLAACQSPTSREDLTSRETSVEDQRAQLKDRGKLVRDRLYLGSRTLDAGDQEPLPPALAKPGKVVINSQGLPLTLTELGSLIAAQTGVPVRIEDSLAASSGTPPAAPPAANTGGGMALVTGARMTLPDLLSQVSTWFGVSWRYEGGEILIRRYETRTYPLASLTTAAEVDTKVSTSGMESFSAGASSGAASSTSSGSSGGGDIAKHETRLKAKFDVAADIKAALEDLVGGDGKVALSPALGTVTVTARPGMQRHIAAYLRDVNALMTRQVRVNVQVLSITAEDSLDLSSDIGVVLDSLGGVSLAGATPTSSAISGFGQLALSLVGGKASGSSVVIKALSAVGNTRLETEGQVTTLNGKPAPLVVARQKPYVVGTTTTLYDSGSVTSTQIGNLVLGYAMQVMPRVLDDNELLLHFSVRMTELRAMDEFTSGGQTYQQPDVDLRAFTQEARLKSGDTLVLTGFQSMDERASDSGLPVIGPILGGLFGGQTGNSKSRTTIVLLITPIVERGA